ncbi:hypothetical protein Tco_0353480 [Tanacetum coccineum]
MIQTMEQNIKTLERNRKTVALEEINSIEKRIDEGFAMPYDNDHRLILLQEIEKIDKFALMDIIQKAHVKWVTLEEIKEVVWDCGSSKAPGPDGKESLSLSFSILVMEGLHNAFEEAVGNGFITGVNIKNSTINVFIFFYADDLSTLLFFKNALEVAFFPKRLWVQAVALVFDFGKTLGRRDPLFKVQSAISFDQDKIVLTLKPIGQTKIDVNEDIVLGVLGPMVLYR